MDIMETIRARYSEVSSVQKRIADYCLEHPDKASFQTLREFAQTTHTTDATVLKFCSNMGCQGFLAFRRQIQAYVRMSPPMTTPLADVFSPAHVRPKND